MADDRDRLADVAAELEGLGLEPGTDFYIAGLSRGVASSEHIGLKLHDDGQYEVWYRDMGRKTEIQRTRDCAQARRVFVEEVVELARGRGRGPRADRHREPDVPLSELRELRRRESQ